MLPPIREQLQDSDEDRFLTFKNLPEGGREAIIISIADLTQKLRSPYHSDQCFLEFLRKHIRYKNKLNSLNQEPDPRTKPLRTLQKLRLKLQTDKIKTNAVKFAEAADNFAVVTGTVISKIPANETELWTTRIILIPEAIRRQNYTRKVYHNAKSQYNQADANYNAATRV